MITGADFVEENLEDEWPEGFEAGPTDNPEDKDVETDPKEDMPWPETHLILDWWEKNKSKYQSGSRYLCGKPITVKQCQQVLRTGFQPQRRAAALELALLQPEVSVFNMSMPGFRQQQLLL